MPPILDIHHLSGGYPHKTVLSDITFSVNNSDFVGILGPNGSGKSTLLRLITRILTPSQGTISFNNQDIASMNLKTLFQQWAVVEQDTHLEFPYRVKDLVLMGRTPHLARYNAATQTDQTIVTHAMALTNISKLRNSPIDQLSAGQRQLVFIAKALAQEPKLLFLDEPTAHLDIYHQLQIMSLLKRLNTEFGLTILVILHDLNIASHFCKHLLLLNQGTLVTHGSCTDVLTQQTIEAVYHVKATVISHPTSGKIKVDFL